MSATGMIEPVRQGRALIEEMERTPAHQPHLWWLGHCGFAIKYHEIIFYIDPLLASVEDRRLAAPLEPGEVSHADMILCSHAAPLHMHSETLLPMLRASKKAKLVLPKSAAAHAAELGIPYDRMTTTDADLRVEYFKKEMYARIYAVPSAHPNLEYTPLGGYPFLGFLVRCGNVTIYHAGGCRSYETLENRLRPYNVTVAILPVAGNDNFTVEEAAQLAQASGVRWLVPMHVGTVGEDGDASNRFLQYMLFHCQEQKFKIFECGEGWAIPPAQLEI